jgi:clan AA aspartic protease
MITGTVSRRRAYVDLTIRAPDGQEHEIEAVLDTGFTGVLTLPPAAVAALSLPYLGPEPAKLADGTRIMLALHRAILLWDGQERVIRVLAMDGAPLIGMSLLDGSNVHLEVTEGGLVTIETP